MDNRHATKLIQELERQNYELKQQNECVKTGHTNIIDNNPDNNVVFRIIAIILGIILIGSILLLAYLTTDVSNNQFLIAIIIAIAGLVISPNIIKGN